MRCRPVASMSDRPNRPAFKFASTTCPANPAQNPTSKSSLPAGCRNTPCLWFRDVILSIREPGEDRMRTTGRAGASASRSRRSSAGSRFGALNAKSASGGHRPVAASSMLTLAARSPVRLSGLLVAVPP